MPETPKLTDLQRAYRLVPRPVMDDLLRYCGVWSPNLAEGSLTMARNEGRRQVGFYILQMLGEIKLPEGGL